MPNEELQTHVRKLRESYSGVMELSEGLQVPVNASVFTAGELDMVSGNARELLDRIDTLDQIAATDFAADNWHVAIAIGALWDHWAAYAALAMEPLRKLQGRKASSRMLCPVWGDMMVSTQHLDKIINLLRTPCAF